jgi:hypothetical protein
MGGRDEDLVHHPMVVPLFSSAQPHRPLLNIIAAMLKHVSRTRLALAWCAVVVVCGAIAVVNGGTAITLANGGLLLMVGLIPPAIMLLVWRGPPPLTIAEVLHDAGKPSTNERR